MGIYIKGIEMPKSGYVDVRIFHDNRATTSTAERPFYKEMVVAEVPTPHGRLIDAEWVNKALIETLEALKKNPKMDKEEMHLISAFHTLGVMVADAPTIIESEEEDG